MTAAPGQPHSPEPRAPRGTSRTGKADHVTCGGPENGLGFLCKHCGAVQEMASPCDTTVWGAASKVFRARHIECPPKEKP